MNKIFIVKEKNTNDSMLQCYTGVISNNGPVFTSFNNNTNPRKFIDSFLRGYGSSYTHLPSLQQILNEFLNHLENIEIEAFKDIPREEEKKIGNRYEIMDL